MKKYWAIIIAILLGGVFVSFVFDRDVVSRGWSIFCWLLAGGVLLTPKDDIKHSTHGRLAIGAGLAVSLSHALYAQIHLTPLNVLLAPLMIIYGAWVLHFGSGRVEGVMRNYIGDLGRIFLSLG